MTAIRVHLWMIEVNAEGKSSVLDGHAQETRATTLPLPRIPVIDVGPSFAMATLDRHEDRAHALFDAATRGVPNAALRTLDRASRRWLARWDNAHLAEIDAIAHRLGRPGTYFLSVNYEWACTCGVKCADEGRTARLVRVLDWRTPGLGRNIVAAKVNGPAGLFVTLTWPGYTGVLQAMAPGRFAAALNQAPMRERYGLLPLDWAAGRAQLWRMPHPTAAHLLRQVFEQAPTYAAAKTMLMAQPIAAPAIYSLAGLGEDETVVIERTETEARVFTGESVAANHWQAGDWTGRPRGIDSPGRARQMMTVMPDLDPELPWVKPPILNARTKLVMVADAAQGRLVARGYEGLSPATDSLELAA